MSDIFLLMVEHTLNLNTREIDFAFALQQSDSDVPMYMEFFAGIYLEVLGAKSLSY